MFIGEQRLVQGLLLVGWRGCYWLVGVCVDVYWAVEVVQVCDWLCEGCTGVVRACDWLREGCVGVVLRFGWVFSPPAARPALSWCKAH